MYEYVHPAAMQLPDDVTILTNKSQNTKGAPFNHEENEKWTFSLSMPWRHVVGSRDIHPLILNLGNSWEEWSASSSGCFIGGKEPKYKLLWGCVSTRHDLEFLEGKITCPGGIRTPRPPSLVAIPTALSVSLRREICLCYRLIILWIHWW